MIGFFAAMLALTFVARAMDALTLPVVTTVSLTQSTLRHIVAGQGVLEAVSELPLQGEAGLIVGQVYVVKGQNVKKGDALFSYDAKHLQSKIDGLEQGIEKKKLQRELDGLGTIPTDISDPTVQEKIRRAQNDMERAEWDTQSDIRRAQEDLTLAQQVLLAAQADLAYVQQATAQNQSAEIQLALTEARQAHDAVQATVDASLLEKQRAYEDARAAYEADTTGDPALETAYHRAEQDLKNAKDDAGRRLTDAQALLSQTQTEVERMQAVPLDRQSAVEAAQAAIQSSKENILAKQRALEDAIEARDDDLLSAQRNLEDAQAVKKAQDRRESQQRRQAENDEKTAALRRQIADLDIEADEKALKELLAIQDGGAKLLAPEDGTVMELLARPGEALSGAALRIAKSSDGYVIRMLIDSQRAGRLDREAEVSYLLSGATRYASGGEIQGLMPAAEGVDLSIGLPAGSGSLGQSASIQLEKKSSTYGMCIPLGALRKVDNVDGVYVLRIKDGILGEEEVLEFVPVRVLDADLSTAAIEAPLTKADRIVTGSTKPIQEADRVRSGR